MDTATIRMLPSGARTVELLSHVPLFHDFSRAELQRMAEGTTRVHADRGRVLFHRGDSANGFHIVVYGQVKLAIGSANGSEKVVEIIGPGRSFGEAVMFMDRPYVVTATALADSLLLHVDKTALFEEIDRQPALARRMLAGLSMRLHMLVKDVEAMTLHSAAQRVIGYLLSLEEIAPGRVTLPAQKSLIASRLNLTPEYFSRILHDLAADGLIVVDGRDIELVDVEGLKTCG